MRLEHICFGCGVIFRRVKSARPAIYCSLSCFHVARHARVAERFWEKVDTSSECWTWARPLGSDGYGKFRTPDGRSVHAQRFAWELVAGPIPAGKFVCHTCDTPHCVRNDEPGEYVIGDVTLPRFGHLFLGSPADNMIDKMLKGRCATGDQHGQRLHPDRTARGDRHPLRLRPELHARGEQVGGVKLTNEAVREIRALYTPGYGNTIVLARRFGVSAQTIHRIIRRVNWTHL